MVATPIVPASKTAFWSGSVISALAVLFLLLDGVIKVLNLAPAVEATVQLGYPEHLVVGLGLIELLCIVVYVIPRTSFLGAVVLTGYLGGAIATHVRIGSPFFSVIFPVILGLLIWGGLYIRDSRLRALFSFR